MATLQSIKLTATNCDLLPNVAFDLKGKALGYLFEDAIAEALYPGIPKDFLCGIGWNREKAIDSIRAIFTSAIVDSLTSTEEIADIIVDCVALSNGKIWVKELTLATTDPMNEQYARDALAKGVNADAANLIIESDIRNIAKGVYADYIEPTASLDPRYADLVRMWQTRPMEFANMVYDFARQHPTRPWNADGNAEGTPEESATYFIRWAVKNQVKLPANVSDPTANTNNQTTPTPMAQTANANIPAGYKVAPAPENATPEQIAEQFKSQFEKALSATSPSGKKLADCTQLWAATTRPNDLPGRIIMCTVKESEQTYHTFTFDCKDRHRDSFTMDEGMKFDWLSVDAMIKAFTNQASVLDCVKEGCKKRLTGGASATPKAQTKTAPAPQPAAAEPAEAAAAPQAPAMPKAQTKSAPAADPQTAAPAITHTPATPQMDIFQTYTCEATPSYYYHIYGTGGVGGCMSIHMEDGKVVSKFSDKTLDSILSIVTKNKMTALPEIPDVVIKALIREGIIKAPMQVVPQAAAEPEPAAEPTMNAEPEPTMTTEAQAAAEQAEREAAEQREREEQERKEAEAKAAAEKAEQERIEREKREAEERAKREAAEKAKREEEERKRKKAEEEAKRKAEEEEAKKRIEEEKQKIAKRNATMTIRHRDYDKIRIEVELQPLTRTGQYFWGDAGTGKTHMAKMLADDFGLKFHYQGVVQAIHDFKGMVDGHGRFHATAAYYAATQGGLLLLDEMDRYPEDALIWLNGLIANRYASFYVWDEELQCVSEQTITAHPDFRVIGTGNTNGEGPTPLYTAAVQLDASTLDRFNFTHVDYDERVELAIAEGDGELVEFIEAFRATVRDCRFNNLVTYRAVETIHVYMKDGRIDIKDALTDRIVKGMSTENQRFVANRLGDHVNVERNKYAKAYCELANANYRSAAKVA